jgi:transposase
VNNLHYIGFDLHKKTISYCVKAGDGTVIEEGTLRARRAELESWAQRRNRPWVGAMEATLFTGWVHDQLRPWAQELKVAHPAMLEAITKSKKKNDREDARTIADLLRCHLLPEAYLAPPAIRELRQVLRYRTLVVRQAVRMKNKIAGLLMESGAEYNKKKLHGKHYFAGLLETLEVPASVTEMLRLSRAALEMFQCTQRQLLAGLARQPLLRQRVERLQTVPGVGEVLSLTWALEVGEPERFSSIAKAVSYCGLTSREASSAGRSQRGPISKQRNKHLQWVLIEVAKLAPQHAESLAALHARELARGAHRNRATLAVARKLVAYLLAIDKSGQPFVPRTPIA